MAVNHVQNGYVQNSDVQNSPVQTTYIDALREEIKSSLEKAQVQRSAIERHNSNYATLNLIFSVIAALLAGTAGILGTQGGMWKETCLFSAAFSAAAMAAAKTQMTEQMTDTSECVGQLKALKVETLVSNCDWGQVSEKYQHILSEFVSIDCSDLSPSREIKP
jgi:hypothetical protein